MREKRARCVQTAGISCGHPALVKARAGASQGRGRWRMTELAGPPTGRACAAASGPAVTRRHCAKAERAVIRHERPRRALRIAARRFVIDHSAADNPGLPLLIVLKATRNRNSKNYPSKNRDAPRTHASQGAGPDRFWPNATFVYIGFANVINRNSRSPTIGILSEGNPFKKFPLANDL